jgi:hypothetical protein
VATESFNVIIMLGFFVQLLLLMYLVAQVGRLQAIEQNTSRTVLLLTILANRQGATQADIDNAMGAPKG